MGNKYFFTTALIFLLLAGQLSAQLIIRQLPREKQEAKSISQAKLETNHLTLPFWDDFSNSGTFPRAEYWEVRENVWVNSGAAEGPPSINVATFDGSQGNGLPYSLDAQSDGPTDRLTSQLIDLSAITAADDVFLSFFIQAKGRGELPNSNDSIRVEFKLDDGSWLSVWRVRGDEVSLNEFELISIHLDDPRFFHFDFQFRFQAFGRQTGPYDSFHIDYIYLNDDVLNFNFPDRALQTPASSPFGNYTSVPIKHFHFDPPAYTSFSEASAYNLYDNLQPTNFSTIAYIKNYDQDLNITEERDTLANEIASSFPNPISTGIRTLNLVSDKLLDPLKITSDTLVEMELKLFMNTDDNNPPDYDAAIYSPLDFRVNDTISSTYILQDYYSYDDGTAEYGAGLNKQGDMVVVQFPMAYSEIDTLVSVDIHFPNIGTSTTNLIDLIIFNSENGLPSNLLYEQTTTVRKAQTLNDFFTYEFETPVIVRDTFYIGWRQGADGLIDAGLDRNYDNGDAIFINIVENWEQNTSVRGSLMIRPRFGTGDIILSAENDLLTEKVIIYPNPSSGIFHFSEKIDDLNVFDLNGRQIPYKYDPENGLELHKANKGMYLLRYRFEGEIYSDRIIIK